MICESKNSVTGQMHACFQKCLFVLLKFCVLTKNFSQYTNEVTDLTHLFCKLDQLCLYLNDLNVILILNLF